MSGARILAGLQDAHLDAIAREAFAPLAEAMIARPALQADLSANQLALKIKSAFVDLDRLIPRHDGPLPQTAAFRLMLSAHAGDIAQALTALLSLAYAHPETPPMETPDVEA